MVRGVLMLGLLLVSVISYAGTPRDPYTYFFNPTFGDFSEELANARAQNKEGIFLFFEMDECPFCHFMKTNVLNQPEVQEYFRQRFLSFPVDIEGDVEIVDFTGESIKQKEFANRNRVRATPVLAFYDLDGKQVHRFTGRTSDVDEFLLMGKFVAERHYETTRWQKYKRDNLRR